MKIWPIFSNWIVSVVFLCVFVPFPYPGKTGMYNTITMQYRCSDDYSCVHELGHFVDQKNGWVSHSEEWNKALEIYILVSTQDGKTTPLAHYILTSKLQHHSALNRLLNDYDSELYANLLAICHGRESEMPTGLRPFYDWSWIERMQK